jgi:hypothetical protein
MLRIASKTSMGLFLFASPFLLYGFGERLVAAVADMSIGDARWRWFIIGSAVFFPVYAVASRVFPGLWNYLATLEHEMAHLLVGLLFLKIPVSIRVSAHEGGEVKQVGLGTTGETWITLAPYFLPTLPLAIVATGLLVDIPENYLMAALGFSTFYHLLTNWAETSFRQPDLKKAGVAKTVLILPLMNVVCYGMILAYVGGGTEEFKAFWVAGWGESYRLAEDTFLFLRAKALG